MPSRRAFLRFGALGLAGLSMPDVLRAQGAGGRRDTALITLFLGGGPSQLDTWDPKPNAPAEIRGEFASIATSVPGVRVCEHLPHSARLLHKCALVRSLTYREVDGALDHGFCCQVCWSGYPATRDGMPVHPSFDCVAMREFQSRNPGVPASVNIPHLGNGPGAFFQWGHGPAYLGSAAMPVGVGHPDRHGNFSPGYFSLAHDVPMPRLQSRENLRRSLDSLQRHTSGMDTFQQQAVDLIRAGVTRRAFDLNLEPRSTRERYGFLEYFRSRGTFNGGYAGGWGQQLLLARRLVEAGVRVVTVMMENWDTHDDNFWMMRYGHLPRFDQAFTALLEDLDQRGMLDTTMVVAFGEMGRKPLISSSAGRDHWPRLMSAIFAGGGVQGGRVIGSSDAKAAEVNENPKLVQDIHATMYLHLGIDLDTIYHDQTNRPHALLPAGRPIHELF